LRWQQIIYKGCLLGFDISNLSELNLISDYKNKKIISITSPNYNPNEFDLKKKSKGKARIIFNCDQVRQYRIMNEMPNPQDFIIRLNSDSFLLKRQIKSRFGVCANQLDLIGEMLIESRHNFLGFHFHNGWQKNKINDYVELAEGAVRLSKKVRRPLKILNLGGGFGNFSELELSTMIKKVRKAIPQNTIIFFEAGRFLSQNSGFAVGHIQNIFKMSNQWHITLDLSKDCHLQWSQPQFLSTNNVLHSQKRKVNIYGPTCSEIDFFGKIDVQFLKNQWNDRKLIGSPIFFSNVSSYSMARNHSFNGIQKARIQFIK
jgi:diaminopimelate decarboxylase